MRTLNDLPTNYRKAVRLTAKEFGVTVDGLLSTTRGSPLTARARQGLMNVLRDVYPISHAQIAKLLSRDRKTIAHGITTSQIICRGCRSEQDKITRIKLELT